MTLIVTATGLAGFLASFILLHVGLEKMWLRYPLAVGVSYCVFLLLLKAWIGCQQSERSLVQDTLDLGDLDPSGFLPSDSSCSSVHASGSCSSHTWSDWFSGLDGDEWVAVIVFLVALIVALLASVFIIVSAPTLLGEVFLDTVVIAALRKKMISVAEKHCRSECRS